MPKQRSTMTVKDTKAMLQAQGFEGRDQAQSQRELVNPNAKLKPGSNPGDEETRGFQGQPPKEDEPETPDRDEASRVNWNSRQAQGQQEPSTPDQEPDQEPALEETPDAYQGPGKPPRGIGINKGKGRD